METFKKQVKERWPLIVGGLLVLLAIIFFSGAGSSSKVKAQVAMNTPWVKTASASFRLIPALVPKQWQVQGKRWSALQVDLDKGAKTYWRAPGDTGVPPSFDWSKSDNLKNVKISWPAPHRFREADSMAVGYKNDVTLPLLIEPKDPTRPVILKLDMFMGICTQICIPVEQNLTLTIPVSINGGEDLADVMKTIPRVLSTPEEGGYLHTIALQQHEDKPVLAIEVLYPSQQGTKDLFIEAPDDFPLPLGEFIKAVDTKNGKGGLYHVDLSTIDEPKTLIGQPIKLTVTSEKGSVEINTAVK